MSENKETKITSEVKEKNPKRVEDGKRLAAISKEAKERKMKERLKLSVNDDSKKNYYLIELCSVIIAAASLWFAFKSYRNTPKLVSSTCEVNPPPPPVVINNLETL